MNNSSSSSSTRILELEGVMNQKIEEYERKIRELIQTWTVRVETVQGEVQEKAQEIERLKREHQRELESLGQNGESQIEVLCGW